MRQERGVSVDHYTLIALPSDEAHKRYSQLDYVFQVRVASVLPKRNEENTMSSDNQFTALGPAAVGFQTNSASIDRGAAIAGTQLGALCHSDGGPGVKGSSKASDGVVGGGAAAGVRGIGVRSETDVTGGPPGLSLTTGVGVEGFSESNVGVRGHSQSEDGVVGLCDGNSRVACLASTQKPMVLLSAFSAVVIHQPGPECLGVMTMVMQFRASVPMV